MGVDLSDFTLTGPLKPQVHFRDTVMGTAQVSGAPLALLGYEPPALYKLVSREPHAAPSDEGS